MNFLAHAVIAGSSPSDRVGGVMGDFIKGLLPAGLPGDLASGVELHRAIDTFADKHDAFRQSRARISAPRRRVAGILVDLFYDHLLARDWSVHQPSTMLKAYAKTVYEDLETFVPVLPQQAVEVARSMRKHDWLSSYRELGVLESTIERMAVYRFKRANPLPGGIAEFIEHAEEFKKDFSVFLPDAVDFADRWRRERDAAVPGETGGASNTRSV